jgi:hypothetical protein
MEKFHLKKVSVILHYGGLDVEYIHIKLLMLEKVSAQQL